MRLKENDEHMHTIIKLLHCQITMFTPFFKLGSNLLPLNEFDGSNSRG